MEIVDIEYFNKIKTSTVPRAKSHSHLSDEIYQDASTTTTHLLNLLRFLISDWLINSSLTTMWNHYDDFDKCYHCVSTIYLLCCIA